MATPRLIKPGYTIQLTMDDIDLSHRIESVSIINSIKSVYPIFILRFRLNSKDYVLNQMYGQKDLFAKISYTDVNANILEEIMLNLIIININVPLSLQSADIGSSEPIEDIVTACCLNKGSYTAMSTTINKIIDGSKSAANADTVIYDDGNNSIIGPVTVRSKSSDSSKSSLNFNSIFQKLSTNKSKQTETTNNSTSDENTIVSIIESIFKDTVIPASETQLKYNIDHTNYNTDVMGLLTIPPQSFSNTIRYLNDLYGVYNGPLYAFVTYDNIFQMWDLSCVTNQPEAYSVTFLSTGDIDSDLLNESNENSNKFFTYNSLNIKNMTTANVMKTGNQSIFIKKPLNKFFMPVKRTIDEIFNDFGKINPTNNTSSPSFLNQASDMFNSVSGLISDVGNVFNINVGNITGTLNNMTDVVNSVSNLTNKLSGGFNTSAIQQILKNIEASTSSASSGTEYVKNTKTYSVYSENVGGSDSDTNSFIHSKLNNYINNCSVINFKLGGAAVPLTNLLKIGCPITITPKIVEYIPYGGTYVVSSSTIVLSREDGIFFKPDIKITCFRNTSET